MAGVGYADESTMISIAVSVTWTARLKASTSSSPSGFWKRRRLSDARLHAELSRNMYSEHGFEALMRAVLGHVCHLLIVLSYCTPGSAQRHAASASMFHRSLALWVSMTAPEVRARVCHGPPAKVAFMK